MSTTNKKFVLRKKKEEEPRVVECAMKKKYGEANGLIDYLNKRHNQKDKFVLEMLWDQDYEFKKTSMFDYVIKFKVNMPYKGLTEKKLYKTKSGRILMAHYNGDTYIGSVVKLGEKPVPCNKWETPNRKDWDINDSGKFIKRR